MRWKLKDSSDVDIEKSIVDVFPIPGQRERGRQPMAYVVSAEKELLKNYVSLVEKNDLKLKSIDITALALRNVASKFPEDKMGVAFLSLYARRGLLSLSRDSNLFLARDLDVGYENFSNGIENTNSLKAEGDLQLEDQFSVAQQNLEQIVLEVQRSMDYYERYFAQPPIQSLVLAPMPISIPGLADEIAQQLGMNVREMDITEIVDIQQQEIDRNMQSKCLSAVGAALRMTMAA
jgi:MSHA biogenesis protein MshI